MLYRLDQLEILATELGLASQRFDGDTLHVILQDAVLAFCNLPEDADSLVGFDETPWHAHDTVMFSTGEGTYIECDEFDILIGLGSGELVIVTQMVDGVVRDRWIAHRDEPLELTYIQAGEELRVLRLPEERPERKLST